MVPVVMAIMGILIMVEVVLVSTYIQHIEIHQIHLDTLALVLLISGLLVVDRVEHILGLTTTVLVVEVVP